MPGDPHIHVERQVVRAGTNYRNVIASTFGAAVDAPSEVTTGCGIRVPYAMTSTTPELVTCLACREHARREFRAFADQVTTLSGLPGSPVSAQDCAAAAAHMRAMADRFE